MNADPILDAAAAFGRVAGEYQRLRAEHPSIRALVIKRYIHDDQGLNLEQFACGVERGHCWPRDIDERDRCLCCYCGADGDA